ncbi:MAG: cytochrome C biogenesis protein [Spirochaetota bacterium]
MHLKSITLFFLLFLVVPLLSDSTHTNLIKKEEVAIFHKVTSEIRCICLPSLPIKSCSFSNCQSSAKLKGFIENRIKQGDSAETIIHGIIHGYGKKLQNDIYLEKLRQEGYGGLADGILTGLGEKMLANPNPWNINLTLFVGMGLSFLGMAFYLYKRKQKSKESLTTSNDQESLDKYLNEIER